jgi:hypothetical protein
MFFHLSVKKEVRHGYRGGGSHVFFAKLYLKFILYLSYIFIPKNRIFLFNFGHKWLGKLDIELCNLLWAFDCNSFLWSYFCIQWNLSKPNLLGQAQVIGIDQCQVKLTKISHIGTLCNVWFIQESALLSVWFKQVSLY